MKKSLETKVFPQTLFSWNFFSGSSMILFQKVLPVPLFSLTFFLIPVDFIPKIQDKKVLLHFMGTKDVYKHVKKGLVIINTPGYIKYANVKKKNPFYETV